MKKTCRFAIVLCLLIDAVPARAQSQARDLSALSIEDLLNVEVVSASRKEQRAADVPAAVFVLTREDIRRSGMTSIPELLRLVPGVEVAQLNANKWAVSVRGFNALYANKLLVLIDGRSIYNHLFSGVFWETVDLPLQEIERIEVVRGPGGSVWGANAVNGVINIVTKAAADTQGTSVRLSGGTFDGEQAGVRHGGMTSEGAYRVFARWSEREPSRALDGGTADDESRSTSAGFRIDGSKPAGSYTVEGGVTDSRASSLWKLSVSPDPVESLAAHAVPTHNIDANVLGRWTSMRANGDTWQTQTSLDVTRRTDSNVATGRNAADIDTEYHAKAGRHDVVAGAGYRVTTEWATQNSWGFSLGPARQTEHLVNVYAQDEIALGRSVRFTGGAKIEYSNEVGFNLQPTARMLVMAGPRQRVWASISRAIRTPSLTERSGILNFTPTIVNGLPVVVRDLGNPDLQPDTLVTPEAGYRFDASSSLSVDVAVFTGRYERLGSNEPGVPFVEMTPGPPRLVVPVTFGGLFGARTAGLEAAAHWTPFPAWRLDGSYSAFHLTPLADPASQDPGGATWDGAAPLHKWQVRSTVMISPRTEFTALLLYVGGVRSSETPAYTRADARVAFAVAPALTLELVGQNLFAPSHVEMMTSEFMDTTRIPRSVRARLTWRF
jgi:iron complex outermembrane receptor protein